MPETVGTRPLRIYLINLDRAPERLSFISRAFAAAGVDFVRIAATDGSALSREEIDRLVAGEGYWGRLTAGEVGCFLSHRQCWQAIADGPDRFGAVFEDDVLLGEGAGEILSTDTWIPASADIVKLETAGSRIYMDREVSGRAGGREVRRLRSAHYCAGGYILSREAARRLLEETVTFCEAVDDVLFSERSVAGNLTMFQLVPAVCMQRSRNLDNPDNALLPSSIEGREHKMKKRLSLAERLKLVAFRETRSLTNKLLALLGRRERMIVEFR